MITLVNLRNKPTPKYDTYIGRANKFVGLEGSKWANPFVLKNESEREEILEKYRKYILSKPELLEFLYELDNKILACWCCPKACHGNILIELREKQKWLDLMSLDY